MILERKEYITKILPETSLTEFRKNFNQQADSINVYKDENLTEKVTNEYVATGMMVKFENLNEVYKLSVIGDLNEDGLLNQIDLNRLIKHVIGFSEYQENDIKRKSADLNGDGIINQIDITTAIRYIMEQPYTPEITRPANPTITIKNKKEDGIYNTDVEVTIEENENSEVEIDSTLYKVTGKINIEEKKINKKEVLKLTEEGEYEIKAYSYSKEGAKSAEVIERVKIEKNVVTEATAPQLADATGTYDGLTHTVEVTSEGLGGTVHYRSSTDGGINYGVWQDTIPTITNVTDAVQGKLYVQAQTVGDSNHSDSNIVTAICTITPRSMNSDKIEIQLSQTEFTYNGSDQTPQVTITDTEMSKTLTDENYTLTYLNSTTNDDNRTTAGTITVTATGKGNYTGTVVATYKINKANIVFENLPTETQYVAKDKTNTVTVTTGAEGTWTVLSENANIEIIEGNNQTNTSDNICFKGISAGNEATKITIEFRPSDTNNYNIPDTQFFNVLATDFTSNITTEVNDLYANGSSQEIVIDGTNIGQLSIVDGSDETTKEDEIAKITLNQEENKLIIEPKGDGTTSVKVKEANGDQIIEITIKVKKATGGIENPTIIEPVINDTPIQYGSTDELINVSNIQGEIYYAVDTVLTSDNYTTKGSTSIPTASGRNAGTYTVYYYIPAVGDYAVKVGSVSVTINKVSNPTTVTAKTGLTYGTTSEMITVSNKQGTPYYHVGPVDFTESNYQSRGSTSIPTASRLDAQSYTIYYYIPETPNYLEKIR